MQVDLVDSWYQKSLQPITFCLLPFSWLFRLGVAIRRWFYRMGFIKTTVFTTPIIVVGNITVGGTGKTPCVIWLTQFLASQGFKPGIVSRGVGGKKQKNPHVVSLQDKANEVGDEALLLVQKTLCPVVIGMDRVKAVRRLLRDSSCNIIISDDGLQHYRMGRSIEIAMMDGLRRFGNGQLLPAGPLREPISRLKTVDLILVNGGGEQDKLTMKLEPVVFVSLMDEQKTIKLADFPRQKVHAIAGIGHPQRFFRELKEMGFELVEHIFPDHYLYQSHDFNFEEQLPIIMTEKDAVKCREIAQENYWYLQITANMSHLFQQTLLQKLKAIRRSDESEEDFSKRSCHMVGPVPYDPKRK